MRRFGQYRVSKKERRAEKYANLRTKERECPICDVMCVGGICPKCGIGVPVDMNDDYPWAERVDVDDHDDLPPVVIRKLNTQEIADLMESVQYKEDHQE